MTQIILHPGMPKTGTTAIQELLCAEGELMARHRVMYPGVGRYAGDITHHALFYAAVVRKEYFKGRFPPPDRTFEDYARLIEDEIAASDPAYVVLSSEKVWNPMAFDTPVLARIRRAFSAYPIRVLVGLRDIESHVQSSYAQRVTGMQRYQGSIRQHIAEGQREGVWDYVGRLRVFEEVFGREAVHPYWYEDVAAAAPRPLLALLKMDQAAIPAAKRRNVRPDWLCVRVKRYANKSRPISFRLAKSLDGLSAWLQRHTGRRRFPGAGFSPLGAADRRRLASVAAAQARAVNDAYDVDWWRDSGALPVAGETGADRGR